jgi:hypothetical protein
VSGLEVSGIGMGRALGGGGKKGNMAQARRDAFALHRSGRFSRPRSRQLV